MSFVHIHCVHESCMNGSAKEANDYQELVDNDEKLFPGNQLSQLDWEDKVVKDVAAKYTGVWTTAFDWHAHCEAQPPIHDNGKGEWTYQLPAGEARACCIGDQHISSNGITYCICKMDRVLDQITMCWDNRVANKP